MEFVCNDANIQFYVSHHDLKALLQPQAKFLMTLLHPNLFALKLPTAFSALNEFARKLQGVQTENMSFYFVFSPFEFGFFHSCIRSSFVLDTNILVYIRYFVSRSLEGWAAGPLGDLPGGEGCRCANFFFFLRGGCCANFQARAADAMGFGDRTQSAHSDPGGTHMAEHRR